MNTTISRPSISSEAAHAAVGAAVAKGLELGCRVNAAVVDIGGNLVAFLRADGAYLPSITIAQDKAYTAVGFGLPSETLYKALRDNPGVQLGLALRDRVALFGGGLPITVDGQVVGGIGCSGGSEDQDELCSKAGLAAIGLG